MAKVCDGCDAKETDGGDLATVTVGLSPPIDTADSYDLCLTCRARLIAAADPREWVRKRKAKKAAKLAAADTAKA